MSDKKGAELTVLLKQKDEVLQFARTNYGCYPVICSGKPNGLFVIMIDINIAGLGGLLEELRKAGVAYSSQVLEKFNTIFIEQLRFDDSGKAHISHDPCQLPWVDQQRLGDVHKTLMLIGAPRSAIRIEDD